MSSLPLSTLTPIPRKCLALQGSGDNPPEFDKLTFFISLFLAIGIVVSYLPQHYRIVARKSSEGISPYFLLLGGTSSSAAFLNILILQKGIIDCCRFTVLSPKSFRRKDHFPMYSSKYLRVVSDLFYDRG